MKTKRRETHGKNSSKKETEKERTEKRKKKIKSGKKKIENTAELEACINRPFFPLLLTNQLFKVP